ncbi:MAG: (E)-4-hydroxy-3-methylbut-2-enyl-diphosphate synthase [Chitinophagales bacterium]|nr:(E)-4-hydroxy-3-methylbut-2-enyl-diphosphate synthase [Chitinophagales bacterium]MDW8427902.1 (E)-4-hydroxy-3-methylbut-2-enyl-diphosphate synthase [Chitinophagales bacterium]
MLLPYCTSLVRPIRFVTREVKCGDVGIGGNNPIRLQTMTTTDTMDTAATVQQCIRCIEAGSELVRITAPSIREAENLANIKNELRRLGYRTPLVADIHFTPHAAEIAARIVEKVRINPGNYADKKKFEQKEYTDAEYAAELERIRDRFVPLLRICQQYGTVLRIGTNHGSLSDRIMNRYGDTPEGMVESALEFVRIAEDESFYDIVLSMKASNPQVMVQAYRLLVRRMMETGRNYPLHLGVTEAGDGMDGRIKSAIGIGTLLADGLGDTVRVSLTEPPEEEIPVARKLVSLFSDLKAPDAQLPPEVSEISPINPYVFERRKTDSIDKIGGRHVPVVIADAAALSLNQPEVLEPFGYRYHPATDKWTLTDQAADYVYCGSQKISFALPGHLSVIEDFTFWRQQPFRPNVFPLLQLSELEVLQHIPKPLIGFLAVRPQDLHSELLKWLTEQKQVVLVLYCEGDVVIPPLRQAFFLLQKHGITVPVVLRLSLSAVDQETGMLKAAADAGALFIDGFGDGLWLHSSRYPPHYLNQVAFSILQGCRQRISRTEYISCPSCGRTLFDLMETTARIRARTHHLKGIKIAVMGCIVNGPGEMADADYGYVGSGPGKVTLYRGKEIVRRNVEAEQAVDALIELIRENGDWSEPDGQ